MFKSLVCVLVLAGTTACGTPFVKGWGHQSVTSDPVAACAKRSGYIWRSDIQACVEDASVDRGTIKTEAQCEQVPDSMWTGNACVKYADLTSADQCAKVPASAGWTWVEKAKKCEPAAQADCEAKGEALGKNGCVAVPTLTLSGAPASQNLSIGDSIQPITVTASAGLKVTLEAQSCPNFFSIGANNQVTSAPVDATIAGKGGCDAALSGTEAGVSEPVTQKLTVTVPTAGFLSLCNKLQGSAAAQDADLENQVTVSALEELAGTNVCADADKKLSDMTSMDLKDLRLTKLDALAGFSKLQFLHLQGNDIQSLAPIAALPSLQWIGMSGNSFLEVKANRTAINCPTAAKTNVGVRTYCLRDPKTGAPASDDDGR
jgi:hypothetical protein